MNRVLSILMAAWVTVTSMGAATVPSATARVKAPSKSKAHKSEDKPYQIGPASWYGKQFHGRTTANGESFDMFDLTAAHKRLPLGTYVKVTNLRNHRSIVVRINDRGPYVGDRIVDLSYSAARMLNLRGVEKVRLDLVHPETLASAETYGETQ
ncbi:MAG TPA: septal ring lytic transglycosylase RlpA family protein [Verrucomicrobiae bacterium]|jgi:rare lipoprotein A|nr:septal ring lytic transglycosylase RlpA family protein [Verrucomicrobiae bacterium]